MPGSIYNNLYASFIRSGFTKSFTHGYAQSVVAATHPHVLNSQNRPSFAARKRKPTSRLSRLQQLQSAFHTSAAHQSASLAVEHRHEKLPNNHGGLDAYFESLLQQKREAAEAAGVGSAEEEEWVQFQFQNRIEWKPSPAAILLGSEGHNVEAFNAVEDGVSEAALSEEEQAALAEIDAAIEREIEARKDVEALQSELSPESLGARRPTPAPEKASTAPASPVLRARTPASIARSVTPPVDLQSQSYADHLTKLSETGRYAEIPAVFEAMLVASIRPLASSYNALLMAAIHLPSEKIEIVSKALDVYADMMHRNVKPDSDTYNILVGLLAARSLEVSSMKKRLEDKRARYGGMDEPGKFMFASTELEHAILCEDDRLDLAMKLFRSSVTSQSDTFSPETYHQLISACAQSGRVNDMLSLYEHMEMNKAAPFAASFPAMITAFANCGDLVSAVECYNEYRTLAIANDKGETTLQDRLDGQVYAAVINAYVVSNKLDGAMNFYKKIIHEYNVRASDIKDAIISLGFVKGFQHRGIYQEALRWAQTIENESRAQSIAELAVTAADSGDKQTAIAAFNSLPINGAIITPAMALLAMSVRCGAVMEAWRFWQHLSSPVTVVDSSFIEPTAMFAVALIGSGQVIEGLNESEAMFARIRQTRLDDEHLAAEVEEGIDFVSRYMTSRGITDPRDMASQTSAPTLSLANSPYESTGSVSSYEDTFDPYAHNTDFKGSSLISDELEGAHGRRGPRLHDALARFRNMRRAGRHPRYITYAKLISAAARDGKMDLCNDILNMARTDVPLLPQYAVVRYGWSSILDAMVGACLSLGRRGQAEQFHQELLDMGAAPSANTYGLYITTLKESTKTFDEASEAVKIFHRAISEGVEPSSFLYNALIGKLGKARRIDDCLFYFAEMRTLGIKPTSVTYGTIVNALCRVSDEKFAEELFDEMESMPNYKARPAPYNSMMQFFLTTKRDKSKVLAYYERMRAKNIAPTSHTYKLLIDTHATLEPVDMKAAEAVLDSIKANNGKPEAVHYASMIHAHGCVLHDMASARRVFDQVINNPAISASAGLFQALFESMVANHCVADTEPMLAEMRRRRVELTPYIANTLIHGWASAGNIARAEDIYGAVGLERREPSTYEAMTRAYLAVEEREKARGVVNEMMGRGYPGAVVGKVVELIGGGEEQDGAMAM